MNHSPRTARTLVLVALAALWFAPGCVRRQGGSSADSASIESSGAVSEIIVLTTETKERCLKVARRALSHHETADKNDRHSMYRFMHEDVKADRAAVDEATRIASDLLVEVRDRLDDDKLAQNLKDLVRAQSRVCKATFQSFYFKSDYESRINARMAELGRAELALARLAPLSDATRREVMDKYSGQLNMARQGALDEKLAQLDASDWRFDYQPGEIDASAEERREQREAWRREQEWQAEQNRVAKQLHREVLATLKGKSDQKAMPTLGLVTVDDETGDSLMAEIVAWSEIYLQRSELAHLALTQLSMVVDPSDSRYARACKSLFKASTTVLADPEALHPPEENVARWMRQAYERMRDGAEVCLGGDQEGADAKFTEAMSALERAGHILSSYGLAALVTTGDRPAAGGR